MYYFQFILLITYLGFSRNSDIVFVQIVPIIIYGITTFILLNSIGFPKLKKIRNILLFILLVFIGILRSSNPNVSFFTLIDKALELLLFSTSTLLFLNYLINYKKINPTNILLKVLIMPYGMFCLINIVFWQLDISLTNHQELDIGKCVLLSYLGIDINRVHFPFSSGINNFASITGFFLTLVITLLFSNFKHRIHYVFFCFIFVVVLLLTDSRSALFFPLVSVSMLFIFRLFKIKQWFFYFLPIVPLLSPLILLSALEIFQDSDLVNLVSRESEDTTTANGRILIWGVSLSNLMEFKLIHLIGYGEYGHYASGASKDWAFLFKRWQNGHLATPHNTILMTIFDYGYLGLVSIILVFRDFVFKTLQYWKSNILYANISFCSLLYIILIGTTESFLGSYSMDSIYVLLFLVILVHFDISSKNTSKHSQLSN